MRQMNFRGLSGEAYGFRRVEPNAPWAAVAGIALFAARGTYGWRVVRVASLQGKLHDVQPIWAFADAQRYGARAVFILNEKDSERRSKILADLTAGLDPVCADNRTGQALAA